MMHPRPRLRFPGAPEQPTRTGPSEDEQLITSMEAKLSLPEDRWTTRDGRTMLITEMTDPHLISTIAFLRRQQRSMSMLILRRLEIMEKEWERRYGKRPERY
jgi:hypothetical protein